eukprot:CAMPEP_0204545190 /NCGR_PEP_ID=MMETSP0661-20131031/21093_1 /ASSEMBLY_ACC=CAM_ASM_000606 /TAXON_ID=109239 /ORGANISM="Alexandrium margalefi, Strain AMGDE01CS-322" /LENGTH=74 /DNA_ID=CAMNT_0051551979 /DNA_START=205 /DNA_END=425 /DNA_ORIENTATION=+
MTSTMSLSTLFTNHGSVYASSRSASKSHAPSRVILFRSLLSDASSCEASLSPGPRSSAAAWHGCASAARGARGA